MGGGENQLATRPAGWRLVETGVALLVGAAILICLDMLMYLKLWIEIVEAKGIPPPEKVVSTTYGGLPPMALCAAACVVSAWAALRARGRFRATAVVTAVTAAALVAVIVTIVLLEWCPIALLPPDPNRPSFD